MCVGVGVSGARAWGGGLGSDAAEDGAWRHLWGGLRASEGWDDGPLEVRVSWRCARVCVCVFLLGEEHTLNRAFHS